MRVLLVVILVVRYAVLFRWSGTWSGSGRRSPFLFLLVALLLSTRAIRLITEATLRLAPFLPRRLGFFIACFLRIIAHRLSQKDGQRETWSISLTGRRRNAPFAINARGIVGSALKRSCQTYDSDNQLPSHLDNVLLSVRYLAISPGDLHSFNWAKQITNKTKQKINSRGNHWKNKGRYYVTFIKLLDHEYINYSLK